MGRHVPIESTWGCRVMRKIVLSVLVLGASGLAACGGTEATFAGQECETPGETILKDDVEYLCKSEPDGKSRWNRADSIIERSDAEKILGTPCMKQGETRNDTGLEAVCDTNGKEELTWQEWVAENASIPPLSEIMSGGECVERDAVLSGTIAADVADIDYVVPLGMVGPKHVTPTNHSYVSFKDRSVAANDIVSPADGFVVNINTAQENGSGDHGLVIELSCDLYMTLGHLDELAGPLADYSDNEWNGGSESVRIPVRAGEVIGSGGEILIDWGMFDQRVVLQGLHERAYLRHDQAKIHAVSFLDYIPSSMKNAIESRSLVTGGDARGRIDYDVDDSARGNWFEKGTGLYFGPYGEEASSRRVAAGDATGYWDFHLSIAPSPIDPSVTLLAKGLITADGAGVMAVKESTDFSEVRVGDGVRVFTLVSFTYRAGGARWDIDRPYAGRVSITKGNKVGVLLVEILPGGLMRAEVRVGTNADGAPTFTGAARLYERE